MKQEPEHDFVRYISFIAEIVLNFRPKCPVIGEFFFHLNFSQFSLGFPQPIHA